MKILRVIASLDPSHGGPVEGLLRSGEVLQARGHHIEVVTSDPPGAPYLSGVPFSVHALGPGITRFDYAPVISRWVRENRSRFDVAILHGLWRHACIASWSALRGRVPYVVFTHGMLDPWFNSVQPVKRWAKQLLWLGWQGPVLGDAEFVLFTSDQERRLARTSFFGHKYRERVVAYGAADPPPEVAEQKTAFESRLPTLGGAPYLLFLSRIHNKKGGDLLVQAFAEIASQHPELHLVVAGPDHEGTGARLKHLAVLAGIDHRVHFPGMLSGEAKWGAFRSATAFVLPSHQENFGVVVAEAMACGTPVLISDQVNIWREIKSGGGGLIEPDTRQGTILLLTRFLALPQKERDLMGQRARATYREHFGIENAANDLEAVLNDAIASYRR